MQKLALALLLLAARGVLASDGVIEINGARALAGGITPSDAPGFPVTLDRPGSYRLTSDLSLPDPSTHAIEIAADRVWLDLNGFAIVGPASCDAVTCLPGSAAGVLQTTGADAALGGGSISGMSGDAVSLLAGARVRGVTLSSCAGSGIRVGPESLVVDNVIRSVGGTGIEAPSGSAVERNVVARAGLAAGGGVTVSGGTATGGNACDDGRCSPRGERRFYLTPAHVSGDQVLTACASGYHVASLWEITDTSNLIYDRAFGQTTGDLGSGPPTTGPAPAFGTGWVRTGFDANASTLPGRANCTAWTSTVGEGTVAKLSFSWTAGFTVAPPWEAGTRLCTATLAVWCVQD